MKALAQAAIKIGGQTTLARLLGVSSPTVNQWIMGVRPVPVERCAAIEFATGGAITRQELRPDDWAVIWPELAAKVARQKRRQANLAKAAA